MEQIRNAINRIWLNIGDYFNYLGENPIRIIPVVLDLFIVALVLYLIFRVSKNSRMMQLIKGIILIMFITWLSGVLRLTIVHSVLSAVLPSGIIALMIIFQPEIRRGLEQIGTNKFTSYFRTEKDIITKTKEEIYKIVIASEEMARKKIGALIVIQRDINLSDIVSTGIELDSKISPQTLVNIFTPNTPLHDGAVIIDNNKIRAAACILPLASNTQISKELGTRHRAGLGISKESDAIAIIISEESGKISLAKDGKLLIDLDEENLKKTLINNIITNRLDNPAYKQIEKIKKIRIEKDDKRKVKRDRIETSNEEILKEDKKKENN